MKVTVKNCVIRKKSGWVEFDEKRAIKLIAGVLMFCQTEKQKIFDSLLSMKQKREVENSVLNDTAFLSAYEDY